MVWNAIQSMDCHPSAERVFHNLQKGQSKVSRASVFRILGDLSDEGRILRIKMPVGPDCFDHRLEKHYHIQCTKCGAVADIFMETPGILRTPENLQGFTLTGIGIVYEGLCPHCQ